MLTIVFTPFYDAETQRLNLNAVLPTPPVYLIFWGSYWIQGNGPSLQQQMILDAQNVINSSFFQGTAQYGTGGTASYASALATNRTGEPTNGFHASQLADIEHGLASDGYIPHGSAATPTPIFAFITQPGILSDDGNSTIGYNTNLSPSGESANFPTIWCSTAAESATVSSGDYFTRVFSHEMAECMTDFSQNGFEVNPGPTFPDPEARAFQIGDYEARTHLYREYTGALVQSIWSRDDNAFIVREGNTQKFVLANASGGGYDLTLNGDQAGHSDDTFYIDTISTAHGDEVKAVINSEVAVFEPNAIRSITINTLGGTNTVYVAAAVASVTIHGNPSDTVKLGVSGNIQGIQADVTVSQSERVHIIEVDDSADPTSLHPAVGFGTISNLLPNGKFISFPFGVNGANESLTIDTGPGTSSFDVTGTIEGGSVTLNTVLGTDAVNVQYVDTAGPLAVNLGSGTQAVNIAARDQDFGDSIHANVTVQPGVGASSLIIDDSKATAPRQWTIDDGQIASDISGAGLIHYGRMSHVELIGGTDGNTFYVQNTTNGLSTELWSQLNDVVNVLGTGFLSTLDLEGDASAVNIGIDGLMTSVRGFLHINIDRTDVTLDDSADLKDQNNVVVDDTSVTGLGAGIIDYAVNAGFKSLTLKGSRSGATYHVHGIPALYNAAPVAFDVAAGDRIEFGQNGSLNGDWKFGNVACNFTGNGAASHLVMDGSQDVAPADYTIGGNNNLTILDATPGSIGSHFATVTVSGFRSQDEALIALAGGMVNADLTHTSPGTISLDGSVRLLGTSAAAQLDVIAHARAGAVTHQPTGPVASVLHLFNSVNLIGSRPQDSLTVYDSTNSFAISSYPTAVPHARFAAAAGDPMTVTAGEPFDFTVVAQDVGGGTLADYANQVQWYSYNRATGDYASSDYEPFLAADQGQHVFHSIVLPTPGIYSLGFDDGWNASSITINAIAPGQMPTAVGGAGSASSASPAPAATASASAAATSGAAAHSVEEPSSLGVQTADSPASATAEELTSLRLNARPPRQLLVDRALSIRSTADFPTKSAISPELAVTHAVQPLALLVPSAIAQGRSTRVQALDDAFAQLGRDAAAQSSDSAKTIEDLLTGLIGDIDDVWASMSQNHRRLEPAS